MGTWGNCPGAHEHRAMLIYVCCVLYVFLWFKHWLCWKYQYNIYICLISYTFTVLFLWVVVYVWAPVHFFFRGPVMLLRRPCFYCYYPNRCGYLSGPGQIVCGLFVRTRTNSLCIMFWPFVRTFNVLRNSTENMTSYRNNLILDKYVHFTLF